MNPLDWIELELFGNSLTDWTVAAGMFLLASFVLFLARRILRSRLSRIGEHTGARPILIAAHAADKTAGWFLVLVALFLGTRYLELSDAADAVAASVMTIVLIFQGGLWISAAVLRFLQMRREDELKDNPGAVAAMDVLSFVARVAIWSIVLLLMLDNLGVNITALVAGFGVGGIAVALAAQHILGDLFASLSIVLDKPFVVGDFLIIGDLLGSVEKVGIKTTRLRSLSGEQLIFSNNDLLSSRVRNYGRMYERRVVFSLGVTYQTGSDLLREIPVIIRDAVKAQDKVRFDRAHFQKYGDFALVFEAVYYVLSPDYSIYMDIQQAINLQIFEKFESAGIDFAYPTQTVFVRNEDTRSSTAS